ncbi:MAG: cytochrome P450, partial [Halobacteria archaeon]|nr:cytochrome P450 [Halobacteria archaeon]
VLGGGDRGEDGDRGRTPGMSDLKDLDYTEKVIKESMRLYPPVHEIRRQPLEDVEMGGFTIPEGSVVSMPQWVVHRKGEFYDEPDEFRPERWDGDFESEIPDYAYYPFGGGPRRCIGYRFAMIEIQIMVSMISQKYRFDYVGKKPFELSPAVTLQPAQPVEMELKER